MFALLLISVCSVADEPVTAEWLIDKNEATLARIHSLRATVESRGSFDGGSTWQALETIQLIRSGSRERVSREIHTMPDNGVFERVLVHRK